MSPWDLADSVHDRVNEKRVWAKIWCSDPWLIWVNTLKVLYQFSRLLG